jgi:hypothetical protein
MLLFSNFKIPFHTFFWRRWSEALKYAQLTADLCGNYCSTTDAYLLMKNVNLLKTAANAGRLIENVPRLRYSREIFIEHMNLIFGESHVHSVTVKRLLSAV